MAIARSNKQPQSHRRWPPHWVIVTILIVLLVLVGIVWLPRATGGTQVMTGRFAELTGTNINQNVIVDNSVASQ